MSIKYYLLRNELLDVDVTEILLLSVKTMTLFTRFPSLLTLAPLDNVAGSQGSCLMDLKNESHGHKGVK